MDERSEHLRKSKDSNRELMRTKSADYSTDNIAAGGVAGVTMRLLDKTVRAMNILNKNGQANHEGLGTNFQDISNYGLIAQMLIDGTWEPSTQLVYLSGAIDAVSAAEAAGWRSTAIDVLNQHDISTFSPLAAFCVSTTQEGISQRLAQKISAINRAAILVSDVVLANLSGSGRMLGTIREIEVARQANIRVVAFGQNLRKHVEAHDLLVVEDLSEALDLILSYRGEVR